jgi:hypothetical protein
MTNSELRYMMRSNGLCGKVLSGTACIGEKGHDKSIHEQPWTVTRQVQQDPYAKDSRESVTVYVVSDQVRLFKADDEKNAAWLAEVLNAAEGVKGVK